MGSSLELEEEELLQMVRDFIESESSPSSSSLLTCSSSSSSLSLKPLHFLHSTSYFTLQEILRKKTEEERRIEESIRKHVKKRMEVRVVQLEWLVKCLKLDGFDASLCHSSWLSTPSCPCGNYRYIEVMMEDAMKKQQRIIVDIDFESQFEVARATQRYKEVTSKLPNIFVGSEEKLRRIIRILCSAAEESLKERGLHIPPWRRPNYLYSKWKLTNHKDTHMSNTTNKIDRGRGVCPTRRGIVASRLGEWVPQGGGIIVKGRERDKDGGSNLSNQFSNMGINCC